MYGGFLNSRANLRRQIAGHDAWFQRKSRVLMNDLKERTIRGGFARICSQAANFSLRIGSLMVLARLLEPKNFAIVAMVTALIALLNLFRDSGLSTTTAH